ncbi:ankyrin-related protein [Cryptosporidium felis]|nr:ankyrin-related protein [Cryptosporidium felis]
MNVFHVFLLVFLALASKPTESKRIFPIGCPLNSISEASVKAPKDTVECVCDSESYLESEKCLELLDEFHERIRLQDLEGISDMLLKVCPDILNLVSPASGETSLLISSRQNGYISYTISLHLIEHGADVNKMGSNGVTPLINAIQRSNLPLVALLLLSGANIDSSDNRDLTPIFHSVISRNLKITHFLLQCGSNPNIPDRNGLTPLYYLLKSGMSTSTEEFLELLLDYGASITDITHDGKDAISFLIDSGNKKLLDKLTRHTSFSKYISRNNVEDEFVSSEERVTQNSSLSEINRKLSSAKDKVLRIITAIKTGFSKKVILSLLAPEIKTLNKDICIVRDSEGRNLLWWITHLGDEELIRIMLNFYGIQTKSGILEFELCDIHESDIYGDLPIGHIIYNTDNSSSPPQETGGLQEGSRSTGTKAGKLQILQEMLMFKNPRTNATLWHSGIRQRGFRPLYAAPARQKLHLQSGSAVRHARGRFAELLVHPRAPARSDHRSHHRQRQRHPQHSDGLKVASRLLGSIPPEFPNLDDLMRIPITLLARHIVLSDGIKGIKQGPKSVSELEPSELEMDNLEKIGNIEQSKIFQYINESRDSGLERPTDGEVLKNSSNKNPEIRKDLFLQYHFELNEGSHSPEQRSEFDEDEEFEERMSRIKDEMRKGYFEEESLASHPEIYSDFETIFSNFDTIFSQKSKFFNGTIQGDQNPSRTFREEESPRGPESLSGAFALLKQLLSPEMTKFVRSSSFAYIIRILQNSTCSYPKNSEAELFFEEDGLENLRKSIYKRYYSSDSHSPSPGDGNRRVKEKIQGILEDFDYFGQEEAEGLPPSEDPGINTLYNQIDKKMSRNNYPGNCLIELPNICSLLLMEDILWVPMMPGGESELELDPTATLLLDFQRQGREENWLFPSLNAGYQKIHLGYLPSIPPEATFSQLGPAIERSELFSMIQKHSNCDFSSSFTTFEQLLAKKATIISLLNGSPHHHIIPGLLPQSPVHQGHDQRLEQGKDKQDQKKKKRQEQGKERGRQQKEPQARGLSSLFQGELQEGPSEHLPQLRLQAPRLRGGVPHQRLQKGPELSPPDPLSAFHVSLVRLQGELPQELHRQGEAGRDPQHQERAHQRPHQLLHSRKPLQEHEPPVGHQLLLLLPADCVADLPLHDPPPHQRVRVHLVPGRRHLHRHPVRRDPVHEDTAFAGQGECGPSDSHSERAEPWRAGGTQQQLPEQRDIRLQPRILALEYVVYHRQCEAEPRGVLLEHGLQDLLPALHVPFPVVRDVQEGPEAEECLGLEPLVVLVLRRRGPHREEAQVQRGGRSRGGGGRQETGGEPHWTPGGPIDEFEPFEPGGISKRPLFLHDGGLYGAAAPPAVLLRGRRRGGQDPLELFPARQLQLQQLPLLGEALQPGEPPLGEGRTGEAVEAGPGRRERQGCVEERARVPGRTERGGDRAQQGGPDGQPQGQEAQLVHQRGRPGGSPGLSSREEADPAEKVQEDHFQPGGHPQLRQHPDQRRERRDQQQDPQAALPPGGRVPGHRVPHRVHIHLLALELDLRDHEGTDGSPVLHQAEEKTLRSSGAEHPHPVQVLKRPGVYPNRELLEERGPAHTLQEHEALEDLFEQGRLHQRLDFLHHRQDHAVFHIPKAEQNLHPAEPQLQLPVEGPRRRTRRPAGGGRPELRRAAGLAAGRRGGGEPLLLGLRAGSGAEQQALFALSRTGLFHALAASRDSLLLHEPAGGELGGRGRRRPGPRGRLLGADELRELLLELRDHLPDSERRHVPLLLRDHPPPLPSQPLLRENLLVAAEHPPQNSPRGGDLHSHREGAARYKLNSSGSEDLRLRRHREVLRIQPVHIHPHRGLDLRQVRPDVERPGGRRGRGKARDGGRQRQDEGRREGEARRGTERDRGEISIRGAGTSADVPAPAGASELVSDDLLHGLPHGFLCGLGARGVLAGLLLGGLGDLVTDEGGDSVETELVGVLGHPLGLVSSEGEEVNDGDFPDVHVRGVVVGLQVEKSKDDPELGAPGELGGGLGGGGLPQIDEVAALGAESGEVEDEEGQVLVPHVLLEAGRAELKRKEGAGKVLLQTRGELREPRDPAFVEHGDLASPRPGEQLPEAVLLDLVRPEEELVAKAPLVSVEPGPSELKEADGHVSVGVLGDEVVLGEGSELVHGFAARKLDVPGPVLVQGGVSLNISDEGVGALVHVHGLVSSEGHQGSDGGLQKDRQSVAGPLQQPQDPLADDVPTLRVDGGVARDALRLREPVDVQPDGLGASGVKLLVRRAVPGKQYGDHWVLLHSGEVVRVLTEVDGVPGEKQNLGEAGDPQARNDPLRVPHVQNGYLPGPPGLLHPLHDLLQPLENPPRLLRRVVEHHQRVLVFPHEVLEALVVEPHHPFGGSPEGDRNCRGNGQGPQRSPSQASNHVRLLHTRIQF